MSNILSVAFSFLAAFVQSDLFSYWFNVIIAIAVIGAIVGVIRYVCSFK